jgi:hypothetical protein
LVGFIFDTSEVLLVVVDLDVGFPGVLDGFLKTIATKMKTVNDVTVLYKTVNDVTGLCRQIKECLLWGPMLPL